MRCYRCGAELSEHNFCTNCGVDVGAYKHIVKVSNRLYNEGLDKARVRDLSGAVISLRQSLKFNKNNIKARNLLGLVYYEMGEVVAALCEWVISTNLRKTKNVAADYIEKLQSNANKMDTLNSSLKKYNQAYQYCLQSDGRDMAVIQLKKVIAMNPKLVKAYQLLALVYLSTGRTDAAKSAKKYLLEAQKIDVNSTMTLRYLAEAERILTPDDAQKKGKDKPEQSQDVIVSNVDNNYLIQPAPMKEKKGSNTVLNILIGIAVGFAIAFLLVLPAKIQQAKSEAQAEIKNFGIELDAKNLTIADLEKTTSEQADKIQSLTDSLSAYAGTEGTLASMENLLKAAAVYLENPENYLEIADYITSVDETQWTEDTSENYKNLYYALKNAIGPNVCDAYYMEGNTAYGAKQYEDAMAYLEAAVFFNPAHQDAQYLLAVTYNALEKVDKAKEVYSYIKENFPGTWYAAKAEKYLSDNE